MGGPRIRLLTWLAAGLAAGCGASGRCKDGTLFLTLTYDSLSSQADAVDVEVTVGASAPVRRPIQHRPPSTLDTVEVGFSPRYPRGQAVTLEVIAAKESARLGGGHAGPTTFEGSCTALTVAVVASPAVDRQVPTDASTLDIAPTDLAADLAAAEDLAAGADLAVTDWARPDSATPDLATPDLVVDDFTVPPDLATPDLTSPDLTAIDLTSGTFQPSCNPTANNSAQSCGPSGNDDCCSTATAVPGGTFYRSYDGRSYIPSICDFTVTNTAANQATVSSFRLDKYEVTVGRFRAWVNAGFPTPAQGAGARTLGGVANQGGWDTAWNVSVASSTAVLKCDGQSQTWTDAAGANETKPMNCLNWYDAFAFCVWDGGFLPTEAEWNFAAAGGSDQRAYPWSLAYPPGSAVLDATYAVFLAPAPGRVGAKSPKGDGRWGHADLAGNAWEWVLDVQGTYPTPCSDCASLSGWRRVLRGGSFSASYGTYYLLTSYRFNYFSEGDRAGPFGARCARGL